MLRGEEVYGCKKCYVQEQKSEAGLSMRQNFNKRYDFIPKSELTDKFDGVRYIEMAVDNICNLQCKICDSKFSSKLQKRDKLLNRPVYKKLKPNYEKLDNMDLSQLDFVKILGGEPFITPNFETFLDYLEEHSTPENITLSIVTNGTTIPSEAIINKLNRFKFLHFTVSLDSYDRANDYQRWGSNHTETFKNAQTYEKIFTTMDLAFHSVVSTLNVNKLAKTLNFLQEEHGYYAAVDFAKEPEYLCLLYADRKFLDWAIEQNSDSAAAQTIIKNFLRDHKYNAVYWNEFLDTTEKLDTFYKSNIFDYNSELAEYVYSNYDTNWRKP
jgi:sulfatase maturation enzyme AslB (radical SAM superfamily)